MIIKKNEFNNVLYRFYLFIKKFNFRFLSMTLLIFILMGIVGVGGIYYGTKLYGSTYQGVFSAFYRFFKPSITTVSQYYKGFLSKPENLNIHIKHMDLQKLVYIVDNAKKRGIINKEDKDVEVKAKIELDGNSYDVKLKIRGTFLEHVRADKWSFRVKVSEDKTIFGMSNFSLSSPETRGHIHEWVFQKALEYEGLISLRYKFVNIILNGKNLGIYALEEFFDKRLIENNRLREGIIVKPNVFDSNGDLFVYKKNKVKSNAILKESYNRLTNNLKLLRKRKINVAEVFDIKKSAKYFALTSIFGGQHGHLSGNFVCYFNPITNLLEPIGYDSNVARIIERYGGMITSPKNDYHKSIFESSSIIAPLFAYDEFIRAYIKELKLMIDENYLTDYFAKIDEELNINLNILYKEYPYFNYFERNYLASNINYIIKQLTDANSVKVNYVTYEGLDRINLLVDNLKDLPIEIIGLEQGGNIIYEQKYSELIHSTINEDEILVRMYYNHKFKISEDELFLQYKVFASDDTLELKLENVPTEFYKFVDQSINKYLNKKPNIDRFQPELINHRNQSIEILPGVYELNENMIIPPDNILYIHQGVELNLLDSASILSYSPVYLIGTVNDPIIIKSTDSTGQGLSVVNSINESILKHVYSYNLSSFSNNGWTLTGSFNFYESDVNISHCYFNENFSEDALNIIRSKYVIDDSFFKNIHSDAFDSDFSNGKVINSSFINCGNDGIDVSGSSITINNIKIDNAGDKGVSVGENSTLKGENINIINTEIGIASKDLSYVNIENISIKDSKIGFTAFQKKPEFGPGKIIVNNLTLENLEESFLIENKSEMIVDNKIIKITNAIIED